MSTLSVSSRSPSPHSAPKWFLDIPFEWRMSMSALGVRWDPQYKACVWTGDVCPPHLGMFKVHPLSWGWHQQYHANGGRHLEPITTLAPTFVPRPHQNEATALIQKAYASKAPGFVLADEVGVGKTMSAWGFALATPQLRTVLIVTTASAQAHWRNTVRHAGWLPTHSVVVINYDQLGRLFEEPEQGLSSTRKKGKRKRLAKQGTAPAYDLVVFDESHKGKNPTSARGVMMRKIEQRAKFCIFASATAGQTPVELVYLAQVLAFATKRAVPSTSVADFAQWCAAQGLAVGKGAYGAITWEPNDSDLATIHQWLFSGPTRLGIRRLPEDINDWPALSRQVWLMDLDPHAAKAYATMWEEFVANEMRHSGKNGNGSPSLSSTTRESNRLRLRQQSSWLRIPLTTTYAQELLEQGKKVAISVAFRKTMEELLAKLHAAGISAVGIDGQMSPNEKERNRLAFQDGPAQVMVFTVEEAISLHQGEYANDTHPRVLLIHDIRWSAIQMAQIEGRCHRDGKKAPVMWLAAADTVDVDIAHVMIDKVKSMKAMHGDNVGDLAAIEQVLAARIQGKPTGK